MRLRTALSVVGIAATAAGVLACTRSEADGFAMVSVEEVERLLGAPDVRVFDANTRATFERGHVPGATFVDSRTLERALPQDKSARLVFYCKNPH